MESWIAHMREKIDQPKVAEGVYYTTHGFPGPGTPMKAFLDKYLFGCREFTDYLELCGGVARLEELRGQELHPERSC